jgi:peptide/nickel transport system permease protein
MNRWQIPWLALWILAAFAVWIALGNSVFHYDLPHALASPGWPELAGCDAFGRNLIPLTLRASLVSIAFSLAVVIVSLAIAIGAGASIALLSAPLQALALRLLEGTLAFPSLIIALAWAAIRGAGWSTLVVALLMGVLPSATRLLYLRSKEILTEEYIEAAVALGATRPKILLTYLIPELVRLAAVKFPALFAQTLLAEATLSFLGVGAPIGHDTWGSLLAQGKDYLIEAPHLAFATGLPLVLTVLALQGLSERLECDS